MKNIRPNTLAHHIYSIVTDFIWLKVSDIERMLYLDGCIHSPASIHQAVLALYKSGHFLRRDSSDAYRYRQDRNAIYTYMKSPSRIKRR